MKEKFLPIWRQDLEKRGWTQVDIILISGDAYVDHPSYGVSVIGRVLEDNGFKVGIIPQPNWRNTQDFKRLGKPRLFFGITSGNVDSMIGNYTANKKPRRTDDYAPGGMGGLRPDRAAIVYANRVREAYKDVPIVLGGIEASLRRFAHYDYWSDYVRRSILLDSRADILVYGMGEQQIVEIAKRLALSQSVGALEGIRGTAVVCKNISHLRDYIMLPSFEEVANDKQKFNQAFCIISEQMNPFSAKTIVQKHLHQFVTQFPPPFPLTTSELDKIYELPYAYHWHPDYDRLGGVKGFETVRFSLASHRGCCGECSFCALYFHQGRIVQSRSAVSIIKEAKLIASRSDFRGTITDIGGPTANLYGSRCLLWEKSGFCAGKKCLVPAKCKNLKLGYLESLDLYRKIKAISAIKHVFIGSGFRYDLLVDDYASEYLEEVCRHHISGLIKVAPEHCSDNVLGLMNKPLFSVYERFVEIFKKTARALNKEVFIVNYFISAHPGSSLKEALKLALYLAKRKICPEQIQDFIPAPMTLATAMYYTERDPFSGKKIYVAKTFRERKMQRAFIQYSKPANKELIIEALKSLNMLHVFKKFQSSISARQYKFLKKKARWDA
jgi:uncharacterized radical SAM protein YgiQ